MNQSFRLTDLRSMPKIKKATYEAPVLLTENGSPEFVLMTIKQYEEMKRRIKNEKLCLRS
jgi:prevent-host-death family protein